MIKQILLLLIPIFILSCKKSSNDPADPDLTTQLVGTYEYQPTPSSTETWNISKVSNKSIAIATSGRVEDSPTSYKGYTLIVVTFKEINLTHPMEFETEQDLIGRGWTSHIIIKATLLSKNLTVVSDEVTDQSYGYHERKTIVWNKVK